MKAELFPFQRKAVNALRVDAALSLGEYQKSEKPQVVSLQAPTGAGKTIIMASLIEDIYSGTERFAEQPEAIFVWLSDSPALNEQSRQKLERMADRLRLSQFVTIDEASFDQEALSDGHIYFLNTQKLSKAGKLGIRSDTRQYTIWETLANTARDKADRLYFIIDEAHRGMQGREAGVASSIMQRFLKGSEVHGLPPMPLVIGMSATAARFNQLVGNTASTLRPVAVSPAEVRRSGLLKDRILITYPDDPERNNEWALLSAAVEEWKQKCLHWEQYCREQHYAQVAPVLLVQVAPGHGGAVSDTDLDDVLAKIEERAGVRFKPHEVVHTFGEQGTISMNGLSVPHVDPAEIAEDKRIRVVLFKENLSTGWDCPRAEAMMSFRRAEDATYVAQLLGRMVRTPLQCHIQVDEYLNDVRLYLPYFNRETVKRVVEELQGTEGGEIPTAIDSESLENPVFESLTTRGRRPSRREGKDPGDSLFDFPEKPETGDPFFAAHGGEEVSSEPEGRREREDMPLREPHPQSEPEPEAARPPARHVEAKREEPPMEQPSLVPELDREAVRSFINGLGLLSYTVRTTRMYNYLKSLLDMASLLTREAIYASAKDEVMDEVVERIHAYIETLHRAGRYDALADRVLELKLSVDVFDVFGESIKKYGASKVLLMSDADLEKQLRAAEARLGNFGFCNRYAIKYGEALDTNAYAVDCILFAAEDECVAGLEAYAKDKFNALNDAYRRHVVGKSEQCQKKYNEIVENSDAVTKHNFTLPERIGSKPGPDAKSYAGHLFVDDDGLARFKLNTWEAPTIEAEERRPDFVCWIRNVPRASWALCLPYTMNGETKAMYPDFLIVRRDPVTEYVIDVLEPHGDQYTDNLPKAKGLARYAAAEPRIGRVQMIRAVKDAAGRDVLRRLDFSRGAIREKILRAMTDEELNHIFETDGFVE